MEQSEKRIERWVGGLKEDGRVSANWMIWDFDGTLARREGLWGRCLIEILDLEEPGHEIAAEHLSPFLRNGFPWHDHEIAHPHLNDPASWWASIFNVLSKAYVGVGYPTDRAAVLAKAARERFLDRSSWSVYEDVVPTLSELRKGGWKHAVLSNHVSELEELVCDLGLSSLIDIVVSSANTGYEKPHPMAYRSVLDPIGDVSQFWMVGDNPIADVAGDERVGIPGILVRSPEWTDEHVAHVTESWGWNELA